MSPILHTYMCMRELWCSDVCVVYVYVPQQDKYICLHSKLFYRAKISGYADTSFNQFFGFSAESMHCYLTKTAIYMSLEGNITSDKNGMSF